MLALFTTTFTVDDLVQPFASVTVTMYAPFARDVTLEIDGVALDEEKEFGPLHKYVSAPVPPDALLDKLSVLPTQSGEFAVGEPTIAVG